MSLPSQNNAYGHLDNAVAILLQRQIDKVTLLPHFVCIEVRRSAAR
jgi:hypothetical protein